MRTVRGALGDDGRASPVGCEAKSVTSEGTEGFRRGDLSQLPDFRINQLHVSPSRRVVEGPLGTRNLEPQVMAVLLCLVRNPDKVVTRAALFSSCWGEVTVGDDS